MRYTIIFGTNNFELCMYNDRLNKVAKITFETEAAAIEYGEDFLKGENSISWEYQDDIGN